MASALPPQLFSSFAGGSKSILQNVNPNRQHQVISKPVPIVDLPALQSASRVLQDQFAKDAQLVPDLGETLSSAGAPTSGLYSIFPDDLRVPFQKRRLIGVPEGLFQYYNTANVTSHLGIIPEIERVWISIDEKLYLWDYVEGQEISSFMDQPDVIMDVCLLKPKLGVFIDEISHLLAICTPVSVLLIGLSSVLVTRPDGRSHKEIKLYATDMSVQTQVQMASVVGSPDGRIFMAGSQDGYLYELFYQETESWFGKRVQLINHSVGGVHSLLPRFSSPRSEDRITSVVSDPWRHVIYTLTAQGSISVYRPSSDKTVQHCQTMSNLHKSTLDKASGSPAITKEGLQVVSLHVISPSEARNGLQLMAITVNATRLYFSPSAPSYQYSFSSNSIPGYRSLQLIHVRFPPTNLLHPDEQSHPYRQAAASYMSSQTLSQPTARPYAMSAVENACYCEGLTLAAQPGDPDGTDFILCMAPDLSRIGSLGQLQPTLVPAPSYANLPYGVTSGGQRPSLVEHAALLAIPGHTWAMAVLPHPSTSLDSNATPAPTIINELATQFSEPPRQFLVLTNVGLTFLAKRRALDYLKAALEEVQSEGNAHPVNQFRSSFGRDQTCAMLLGLASGNTYLDVTNQSSVISTIGPEIAAVAKQAFYDFGERPIWAGRSNYGQNDAPGSAIFSGRREGFALYFARLVRSLWKSKLTKSSPTGLQELNIPEEQLLVARNNLHALKDFLDNNPHLFHASPGDPSVVRSTAGNEQEAWKAEQSSVAQLQALLSRSIEAIAFILLLNDHKLGDLISRCDQDIQKVVSVLTFEDLVATQNGMNVSRALVNMIIDQQIGQQISVDTVSEILQQRCGSFCSTDDVMLYKAKENIRKAVETRNPVERQNWLSESLRLFTRCARILEFDKIREICGDYQQLSYAKGAVELPLNCAQVLDPDNIGLEYWCTGSPANDTVKAEFCERRLRCYDLVLDSLSAFEEKAVNSGSGDANGFQTEDPETVRSHAYELAFSSEDEMFHSTMYDWLTNRGLADELLGMRPPFLEAHLKREPATIQKYQLLWQFYVKDGQPLRAAEVLGILAESTQFDLPLEARLEYLTLAVGNAKSHPVSAGGRHETAIAFLTDLEEKLDVAQVQLELYNTLMSHQDDPGEVGEKVKLLSKQLFTISELYQEYAEPFDLPTMKLLILHVSEHRDENLVRPVWNRVFEDTLEDSPDPQTSADKIISKVVPLGQRYYPSESAFPLRHVASLLVRFSLVHRDVLPYGWAPRILVQCGVPFSEIWDVLHEMYESQIPPFNDQANVQTISSDIAVLLSDWLEAAKRPQSSAAREELPVARIDSAVDQYLSELEPSRTETKAAYESIKRQLRRNW